MSLPTIKLNKYRMIALCFLGLFIIGEYFIILDSSELFRARAIRGQRYGTEFWADPSVDTTVTEKQLDYLVDKGIKLIVLREIRWDVIVFTGATYDEWDWSYYDWFFKECDERGIKVIPMLLSITGWGLHDEALGIPRWLDRTYLLRMNDDGTSTGELNLAVDFVRRVVQRYKKYTDEWRIGNEWDMAMAHSGKYGGIKPTLDGIVEWIGKIDREIKDIQPSAKTTVNVIGDDIQLLQQLAEKTGIDGIGLDIYPNTLHYGGGAELLYRKYQAFKRATEVRPLEIFVSELGYPVTNEIPFHTEEQRYEFFKDALPVCQRIPTDTVILHLVFEKPMRAYGNPELGEPDKMELRQSERRFGMVSEDCRIQSPAIHLISEYTTDTSKKPLTDRTYASYLMWIVINSMSIPTVFDVLLWYVIMLSAIIGLAVFLVLFFRDDQSNTALYVSAGAVIGLQSFFYFVLNPLVFGYWQMTFTTEQLEYTDLLTFLRLMLPIFLIFTVPIAVAVNLGFMLFAKPIRSKWSRGISIGQKIRRRQPRQKQNKVSKTK